MTGTADFIGLNHYSTGYVFDEESDDESYDGDKDVGWYSDPSWPR